jgi:hypothetical protein
MSVRVRDADVRIVVLLWIVGGAHATQILSRGFLIVRLPWPVGVRLMRGTVLCLGSERFREKLDVVFGTRTANDNNEAAHECRVSAEVNDRFVLHIREIDASTLSAECS